MLGSFFFSSSCCSSNERWARKDFFSSSRCRASWGCHEPCWRGRVRPKPGLTWSYQDREGKLSQKASCRPTEKPALSVWQKGCELVITPFPARSGAQVPSNLSRVKLGSLVPPPHAQKFEGAIWVSAHNKAPHQQRAHRRGRRSRLPPSSLPMATLQIFPIGGEFLPIKGVSSSSRQGDYLGY